MTEAAPAPAATPAPAPAPAPAPDPKPAPAPAPAPAAAKPAPAPNALLNDDSRPDPAAPADFPADWREKMAGGDSKRLEQLKRFTSPVDVGKSFFEADAKIRSGKPNADEPMPDPATDAEGAKKWREARGIPADAAGYALPEPITKRLTDEDKPILASFTEIAHKNNLPPKAVEVAAGWYVDLVEAQAAETNARDKKGEETVQEKLREEWGVEYKPYKEIARRYAQEAFPNLDFFQARLPNGELVGNQVDLVKAFAKLGLAEYGDVSFAGGEAAKATASRKSELENLMKTDFAKWEASPKLREELQAIYAAEEKRGGGRQG